MTNSAPLSWPTFCEPSESAISLVFYRMKEPASPWPLSINVGPVEKGLEGAFDMATSVLDSDRSIAAFSVWRGTEIIVFVPRGSELIEFLGWARRDSWIKVCRMESEMGTIDRHQNI